MEYNISILKDANRINEIIDLFKTGLGDTTKKFWQWRLFTDNSQQDKPFAVIANKKRGVARFTSLLSAIGLEDRLFFESDLENLDLIVTKCDFEDAERRLYELKNLSLQFLTSNLEN